MKLKLPRVLRVVLKRDGSLKLRLTAKVKDPAGHIRTVKKRMTPRRARRVQAPPRCCSRVDALTGRDTPAAMSEENVEVVRRFLLAGDEHWTVYADPEIVWNPAEESAGRGYDAVRESLERWKGEWDDYELLAEEFEHVGDQVLVCVRLRGRGRGSGVEIDARFYDLFTLRDGTIVRMDQFTDRAEALEAVGIQ